MKIQKNYGADPPSMRRHCVLPLAADQSSGWAPPMFFIFLRPCEICD